MSYEPAWWLRNGHLQSIYPSFFRKIEDDFFMRERFETPDEDFLDLDWAHQGHKRLIILNHGLEGHSRRPYVLGMAKAAITKQWDVLAWNYRSCSGEPNRQLTSYHSGVTRDLSTVVQYANSKGYDEIALIGFSIGGNKTVRYLDLCKQDIPKSLIGAVVFSVPYDLVSASEHLAKPRNALYMKNFLVSLREKLEQKKNLYPEHIDLSGFSKIKTFKEFDDRYTAPMNGFDSAVDYWQKSGSKNSLKQIEHPVLMVSALDDPFLTPECFPFDEVSANPNLTFEAPRYGGHIGFIAKEQGMYWSEARALKFLNQLSRLN